MYQLVPWLLSMLMSLINIKSMLYLSLAKKSSTNSPPQSKGLMGSAGELCLDLSCGSALSEPRGSGSGLTYLVGQQPGEAQLLACSFDTAYETPPTRAANVLRHLSDKSVAKQMTRLEQYLPR